MKNLFPNRACLLIGFLYLFSLYGFSQNSTYIDSLKAVYRQGKFKKQDKLRILTELASEERDPNIKLSYSEKLIASADENDSLKYLFLGYLNKGTALRLKSDFSQALNSYFEAANIANKNKIERDLGLVNIAIADVYSLMENHKNAISYYEIGIELLKKIGDSLNFANGLSNLGDEYFMNKQYDQAIIYFMESGHIFKKINSLEGTAFNLGNMGMVYAQKGKDNLAKAHINEAIQILEKLELYYPISVYLTYMSDIYLNQDNRAAALNYSKKSLELAIKYGLKEQISEAALQISKLYEDAGNYKSSLSYFKDYSKFKDSVNNLTKVQEMADLRTDFEVSQKQIEVDLLTQQKKNQEIEVALLNQQKRNQKTIVIATIIALLLICMLAFGLYRRNRYINKTKKIIEGERNRSDNLLLNILPAQTALELKKHGKVQAKKFELVSVMFTDFKNFTNYSEKLSPEDLVKSVDFYFSKFDEIIEKYQLEKIKTIGDSYMCAGGLPFPSKDHAIRIVLAALEISEFARETRKSNTRNIMPFNLRIGINTGPVVAGVVGTKKFAYDIWGDTVNIASRMEATSLIDKINISENTFQLVKDAFECEFRGAFEVKNKGEMNMYFVNGIKDKAFYNFVNTKKILNDIQ
ncbi:MAG TPA: adenylate/guanylate cyclase domain-containing protein [Xanthomarina sp.]|nr:adenylate/guanylate cyclase domain-containing protein [Xanthomarina sp.]